MYIIELNQQKQDQLKQDLINFYNENGINYNEVNEYGDTILQDALNSKLHDIDHILNISKYL